MKRTTLLLLLCWCCLSSSPVRAEWKLLELTDDAAYYVDEVFQPGVVARVWGLVDYRQPNQLGSRSAKILWEIDCARSRVRTLLSSLHPNRMGMGEALRVDRSPGEWALPPEDSHEEALFILACGIEPIAGPKT